MRRPDEIFRPAIQEHFDLSQRNRISGNGSATPGSVAGVTRRTQRRAALRGGRDLPQARHGEADAGLK